MTTSTLTREAHQERTEQFQTARHTPLWSIFFWAAAAVGYFGAVYPAWSPWNPVAFAGTALMVTLGLLSVRVADARMSERTWRRLRLLGYLAGALVLAHQLTHQLSTGVTGLSRTGSFLLYGTALVTAIWTHVAGASAKAGYGSLLIASGTGVGRMRHLLRGLEQPVVVYRARDEHEAACAEELRDLAAHLIIVEGHEHDPRAKELISASGLSRIVPDVAERAVFVTGPRDFTRYVRGSLDRLRLPARIVRAKRRQST